MSAIARSRRLAQAGVASPRVAIGGAAFWASSLGVGAMTFVVLAVLSGHLPAGGLAAVSAVLGLSYVIAVPPGALQLRATAAASRPGADLSRRPPRFILALAGGLAAVSPLLAHALRIPITAVALGAVQLPFSCALGSVRGSLIGRKALVRASGSFATDAACRLGFGVGLGLVWGATGVAAALLASSILPLVLVRAPDTGPRSSEVGGTTLPYIIAFSAMTLLTNVDVLLGPRVLGGGADAYAAAAVPAKGIFFAVFSVSWIVVAASLREERRSRLLLTLAGILGLGLVGAALLLAIRPWLAALLHHGEPSFDVLLPLAIAMSVSGAASVAVSLAVARGQTRAWVAALGAAVVLGVGSLVLGPDRAQLALGVLVAQSVALLGGVRALLASAQAGLTGAPVGRRARSRTGGLS